MLIELLVNFSTPLIISFLMGLSGFSTVILITSVFLYDVDHLLYILYKKKRLQYKEIVEFTKKEYSTHNPHFYTFHTVEFLILISFISFLVKNAFLNLILLGFLINFTLDIITYLKIYKSHKPWLKYFSLIYFLYKKGP